VLLVSIDSLRADHLGSYGHRNDTSPTIDALAREGALFEAAISSAPWTIPAHATMLSGLPPEVHGVTSYRRRLAPEAITLAEVLRDAGYATAAFVSGPTVMAQHGFDQGFASYDESMVEPDRRKSARGQTSPGLVTLVDGFLHRWSDDGRRAPFFVFLHMWDVHYDYAPPPPYDRMFDPDYQGDMTADDFTRNTRITAKMDPRDLAHVRALYDGEIRCTDDHLGRIVATLRALDALDDTIVVVTADHGEEFFEHGLKGHGVALHDEVIRIPLVVRWPRRIAAGQRVSEQVRLGDLAPTILGLAGVPSPPGFAAPQLGEPNRALDVTSWITSRDAGACPALPAFSQTLIGLRHESVRTPTAKLIRRENPKSGKTRTMLYDLEADPREKTDLAPLEPRLAFAPALQAMLAEWRAETGRQTALSTKLVPARAQEERLRALGYVE
jgi:arylsulfatase A-like enzyme